MNIDVFAANANYFLFSFWLLFWIPTGSPFAGLCLLISLGFIMRDRHVRA